MGRIKNIGRANSDIEALYRQNLDLESRLLRIEESPFVDTTSDTVTAPEPQTPFILGRRRSRRGERVTMAFRIPSNITSLVCIIIADADNPASAASDEQIKAARAKILETEWNDINDDERSAGVLEREFPHRLDFLTKYGLLRLIGKVGDARIAKNPEESPFRTAPFPYIGATTFTTCDSEGNCDGVTTVTAPSPDTPFLVESKVTDKGVRPTLAFKIPRSTRTLRARLIRRSDLQAAKLNRSVSTTWEVTRAERLTGKFIGEFEQRLDFITEYVLIRIVATGDNLGGSDVDELRVPADAPAEITGGNFTTGASDSGSNTDLAPDTPFVAGFKVRGRGVRADFNFKIPASTQRLRARLLSDADYTSANYERSISDNWDNFTTAERSAKKATRRFSPTLDFLTTYHLIRLAAGGDNIGGEGLDEAKTPPGTLQNPPPKLATFTTPDSEGGTGSGGILKAATVFVPRQKIKKNGVVPTLRIEIPSGTRRVTAKIQATLDNQTKDQILETTWSDIDDTERSLKVIERGFGQRLDPNTEYGLVRLIAEGDNINAAGLGGNDPDIYRNPRLQPTLPYNYTDQDGRVIRFTTSSPFNYPGATSIPSVPTTADVVVNTVFGDSTNLLPKLVLRVYASSYRNSVPLDPAARGSATDVPGGVSFADVGLVFVYAILNLKGTIADEEKEAIKAGGAIADTSKTFIDIELAGLEFGKDYTYKRNLGVRDAGDRSVAVANPSITIRAGGSIDINQIQIAFSTIDPVTLEDPKNSKLHAVVTMPTNSVLYKNYRFGRQVLGVDNDFVDLSPVRVLDDPANFLPGQKDFYAIITHKKNANIRYRFRINAVKGSLPEFRDVFFPPTGFINTGDEPGFADTSRPQYSGQRSDGQPNQTPFLTPDLRLRWKPTGIRLRFNLPDLFMNTHLTNRVAFVFVALRPFPQQTTQYYVNITKDKNDPSAFISTPPFQPPLFADPNFFIDIGKTAEVTPLYDRPSATSNGDLPDTVMNDLRNAASTPGGQAYMLVEVYIQNRFPADTSQGQINYLLISSQQLFYTDSSPFTGLVGSSGVS